MDITYQWIFTGVKVLKQYNGYQNVVVEVPFQYYGIDSVSGYTYTVGNVVFLNPDDITQFVAFQDLTEEKVLQWITAVYPVSQLQALVQEGIQTRIDDPYTNMTLPFATTNL